MVKSENTTQATVEMGFLSQLKTNFGQYKLRWLLVFSVIIAASIYNNPQGFINLWLTRDQQAMLMVDKKEFDRAALTFSDQRWIAYSYYANGEFTQAASVFAQISGDEALFGQANALALGGDARRAITKYEELIANNSEHVGAQKNLILLKSLLRKQVMKKSNDGDNDKSDQAEEMSKEDLAKLKDAKPNYQNNLSGEMWLQQVKQNPEKFLQKKFQQEYLDANR